MALAPESAQLPLTLHTTEGCPSDLALKTDSRFAPTRSAHCKEQIHFYWNKGTLSVYSSIRAFTNLSVCLYLSLSFCVPSHPSVHPSAYLFLSLYLYASIHSSVSPCLISWFFVFIEQLIIYQLMNFQSCFVLTRAVLCEKYGKLRKQEFHSCIPVLVFLMINHGFLDSLG